MPRHRRGWASGNTGEDGPRYSPLIAPLLEPALLFLLNRQTGHGYTLLVDLAHLGFSCIHPSMVYRTLRDMENLGWIESDWSTDATQGPPRRNYQICEKGQEALKNWKRELQNFQQISSKLIT